MLKDVVLLSSSDRDDLLRIATQQLNQSGEIELTEAFIEKNLWVTFMLKVVFELSQYNEEFRFKGGTSLSKGFNVINRFSEDIDLILDWKLLGYSDADVHKNRSKSQQDKFNKKVNKETGDWVGNTYIPELEKTIREFGITGMTLVQDISNLQTIIIKYPHAHEDPSILPIIRLEIGPLSSRTPVKSLPIRTYLGQAPVLKLRYEPESVHVKTVEPQRTFWEKATILHSVANRERVPDRYSRHYYDLYQLAQNKQIKKDAFDQSELLADVVKFKETFYPSNASHYETATLKQIQLIPSVTIIDSIARDYDQMKNMMVKTPPTLDQIMAYLTELEAEIHQL